MLSRHSVFAVKVASQPVLLRMLPSRSISTFQIAPRAVSAINRSPPWVNATPFATRGCEPRAFWALRVVGVTVIAPGGKLRTSRPTPPTPAAFRLTSLDIGCTRNISIPAPPPEGIFHTRPWPVVPSPVQRLPSRSNASPFVPGTPLPYTVAVGGVPALGVKVQTLSASERNRFPFASKAMPEGLHGAGTNPTGTSEGPEREMRHTGQGLAPRPVV